MSEGFGIAQRRIAVAAAAYDPWADVTARKAGEVARSVIMFD